MRTLLLTSTALVTVALPQVTACSNNDCTVTKTCPVGSSGQGGSTSTSGDSSSQGAGGTTSQGGSGVGGFGGQPETCGNGKDDPGEICFPQQATDQEVGGQTITSLNLYDCDGDSDIDIVTTESSSSSITALRNDGQASFGSVTKFIPFPPTDADVGVVIPSIPGRRVLAAGGTTMQWFTFDATCILRAGISDMGNNSPTAGQTELPQTILGLRIGDFTNNGLDDILVADATNLVMFWAGNTTANEQVQSHGATDPRLRWQDLDGDLREDAFLIEPSSNRVRWGVAGSNPNWTFGANQTLVVGLDPRDAAFGPIDGNGSTDIAVANRGSGTISILLNNGAASFTKSTDLAMSLQGEAAQPTGVSLADLDGDGDMDLVAVSDAIAQGKSLVAVFRNEGDGQFVQLANVIRVHQQSSFIRIGDLNGDGRFDIVTATPHVDGLRSKVSVALGEN